jgi:glycosidase
MNILRRSLLILTLITIAACALPNNRSNAEGWWRGAIFYEIFVRSFHDTNGDGIGDFNGITQKLDYLQSLGITAIWLMPIHPSPSYHGYDVINYYAVNSEYGTLDDFKNLLDEAHKREIKIILDLVINHTSSQHPFFVNANSAPDSEYRDWYVWSDTQANLWHAGKGGYYYGFFWSGMPDLNYRNAEVTEQIYNVVRYWIEDIGVDGFRIDAVKHLIEEDGKLENTPATHDWLKEFYTFYKSVDREAYTVGEVYGAGAFLATTYDQQMDHIFNFEIASGIINSVNGESNTGIASAWKFTLNDVQDGNYATFLTNHDQNRVMSVFNGNTAKAKLAAVILLTAPGTPFIYYGEEIGMQGKKPDEDIRLPMQWDDSPNAGFTTGTAWRAVDPTFREINVAAQDRDSASLINLYRELIALRKAHPALGRGSIIIPETGNTGVYAALRSDGDEQFLVIANLTKAPISAYALMLNDAALPDGSLTSMLDDTQAIAIDKPLDTLPAYAFYIFEIK